MRAWSVGLGVLFVSLSASVLSTAFWVLPGIRQDFKNSSTEVISEVKATRQMIGEAGMLSLAELQQWRIEAKVQSNRFHDELHEAAVRLEDITDKRLGETVQVISTQTGRFNDSLAKVASLSDDVRPSIHNFNNITGILAETTKENFTCKGNGNCWPAKTTAILGGTSTLLGESALTMRYVRKATPQFLTTLQSGANSSVRVADASASIAESFAKQTPIYVRVIGWSVKPILAMKSWLFDDGLF